MRTINKIKIFTEKTVEAWSLTRTRRWLSRIENHYDGLEKVDNDSYLLNNHKSDFKGYIKMLEKQIEKKEKNGITTIHCTENDELSG